MIVKFVKVIGIFKVFNFKVEREDIYRLFCDLVDKIF